MYSRNRFNNWAEGLIHLVVEIALPIIPVVVYLITGNSSNGYLYVLLLTVVASFLYETLSGYNKSCSIWIMVESIVCSVVLVFMCISTIFMLVLSYSEDGSTQGFGVFDYILVSLFIVPVITSIIEIVRCIVNEIRERKMQPEDKNLVKGASKV